MRGCSAALYQKSAASRRPWLLAVPYILLSLGVAVVSIWFVQHRRGRAILHRAISAAWWAGVSRLPAINLPAARHRGPERGRCDLGSAVAVYLRRALAFMK